MNKYTDYILVCEYDRVSKKSVIRFKKVQY